MGSQGQTWKLESGNPLTLLTQALTRLPARQGHLDLGSGTDSRHLALSRPLSIHRHLPPSCPVTQGSVAHSPCFMGRAILDKLQKQE
jgi:hypothetical protein